MSLGTPLAVPAAQYANRLFRQIWPGLEPDETIIALLADGLETFGIGVIQGGAAAAKVIEDMENNCVGK